MALSGSTGCNTTAGLSSSSSMSAGTTSWPGPGAERLLEASIPGFYFFSSFARNYLSLDVSALISTLLPIAAVVAAIRYAYQPLWQHISQYWTSTVEIRNNDEMFNYLMFWISRQQFAADSRDFLAGTRTQSSLVYQDSDDEDGRDDDDDADWELAEEDFDQYWARRAARDKIKNIFYTPREGSHFFRYKGHYLRLTRARSESGMGRYVEIKETIRVSCFGRNTAILKALLKDAQKAWMERDSSKTIIYRKQGDCDDWQRSMARPSRPLSTVVLDPEQKDALINDIKGYLHPFTKRWYANRGIPYRRGYLLYGPPGTGKTSLCTAIAGLFGLKIYVTSLNSRSLTEEGLATLFDYLPERCVVLLEDVDSAGITHKRGPDLDSEPEREKEKMDIINAAAGTPMPPMSAMPSAGITLSGLLNVIDGVASSEGQILIMTTNHVEKLDPALLRPGRVDMSIAFCNANTATAKELFMSTYLSRAEDYPVSHQTHTKNPKGTLFRRNEFSDPEIEDLATAFAAQVPSGEFSPADIQGHLLKHKANPQEAAASVPSWIAKIRDEKERRKGHDALGSAQSIIAQAMT